MNIFGPPNIQKLKSKKKLDKIVKALGYEKDKRVILDAQDALCEMGETSVKILFENYPSASSNKTKIIESNIVLTLQKIGKPALSMLIETLTYGLKEEKKTLKEGTEFIILLAAKKISGQDNTFAENKAERQNDKDIVEALRLHFKREKAVNILAQFGSSIIPDLIDALKNNEEAASEHIIKTLNKITGKNIEKRNDWLIIM